MFYYTSEATIRNTTKPHPGLNPTTAIISLNLTGACVHRVNIRRATPATHAPLGVVPTAFLKIGLTTTPTKRMKYVALATTDIIWEETKNAMKQLARTV